MRILKKVKDSGQVSIYVLGIKLISYKKKNKMDYLYNSLKMIGVDSEIQPRCRIHHPENISIGDNVRIGEGALIEGMGGLVIENNVIFGPDVTIWTANHNYENPQKLPYDEKVIFKSVHIEDNVWIGCKSIIVPGVTIHEGAVIAMGSVVTKDVPKCAVVGGNPAKVLKYRDIKKYDELCKRKSFFYFAKGY
jgi:acetyltransferase-like isoleucine patch superfamily enzyme